MASASGDVQLKRNLLAMLKVIESGRQLISKLLDQFLEMPGAHMGPFILHMCDGVELPDSVKAKIEDSSQYANVFRELIYFHSGREEAGQPCKKQLSEKIAKYIKSDYYKDALKEAGPETDIAALLKEI